MKKSEDRADGCKGNGGGHFVPINAHHIQVLTFGFSAITGQCFQDFKSQIHMLTLEDRDDGCKGIGGGHFVRMHAKYRPLVSVQLLASVSRILKVKFTC